MNFSPLQQQLIQANQQEYADHYPQLRFLSPESRTLAFARRDELLRTLQQVETGCGGSKLDMRGLSPGCRICTEGGWSCLFINGRCNCRCFYCPTSQDEIGLPTTNTVDFRTPADYVRYLERFGFSGASISGGEPLLTPERSLAFISAIKRRFGAGMHVWLYTNGSLVDKPILARLQDAGLDEIRFDIGATGYRLDHLALAAGVIPTVTVEIPAIPEELEQLKALLPVMAEMGIKHLNLHQLRLTPFNLEKLLPRNYTYLHGEKVTVLESELMALELLRYGQDRKLGLPINYCSFVYKNRYQALASRQRNAVFVGKGFESLTAAGYLRTLTLLGTGGDLTRLVEDFRSQGLSAELWQLTSSRERLAIHPQLWPLVDFATVSLQVSYSTCRQLAAVSYRNPFVTVKVGARKEVVVERSSVGRLCPLFSGHG
ncbi:MAG: radical SAM protein [Desulfuromonadaceae bacterium]